MSTTRLTFLYPHLFRSGLRSEAAVPIAALPRSRPSSALRSTTRRQSAACFATGTRRGQSGFAPRVGKGVEPTPTKEEAEQSREEAEADTLQRTESAKLADRVVGAAQASEAKGESSLADVETIETASLDSITKDAASSQAPTSETEAVTDSNQTPSSPSSTSPTEVQSAAQTQEAVQAQESAKAEAKADSPLGTILQMGPPSEEEHKSPHLRPPPYVHHFDSYSLVKQLSSGGYTAKQSITAMKAVRSLLAENLDVAQEGLVSKSDVENETYLFRAACSELSAEVQNRRRTADEAMRQQRTLLQHEVDILTQSLTQELRSLDDNVRGMFNDRKQAVREEMKGVDGKVRQPPPSAALPHLSLED
jgi:hypothetical protein